MQINLKKVASRWHGAIVVAPVVSLSILAARALGWMQPLELAALDLSFQLRPSAMTDERIAIVGATERDIENLGGWPTNDWILAAAIEKIKAQHPRVIGLDIYRNRSIAPGSQKLVRILRSTPNLIGVEKVVSPTIPPSATLKSLNQSSSSDVALDADGVLRRAILFPIPGQNIQSLGLAVALIYLHSRGVAPQMVEDGALRLGATTFKPFESGDGGYVNADAGGYQILLDFRGVGRFKTVSLTDVLHDRVDKNFFRDRIVLIGGIAPSLNDAFFTPKSRRGGGSPVRTSGVEIQAHLASQILDTAFDRRSNILVWNDALESFSIIASSTIAALTLWQWGRGGRKCSATKLLYVALAVAAIGGAGIAIGSYALFLGGWWVPVVPAILATVSTAHCLVIYVAAGNLRSYVRESEILRSRLAATASQLEAKIVRENASSKSSQKVPSAHPLSPEQESSRQRLKERYRERREPDSNGSTFNRD
ncbi:CHASE2 domain-containing protein [Chroococcidiopsis sp. SAG 2025]|uniref:CHASE2 domain-containing protein n=1 Tax=Chroococcidiopsis sp. SAG 2025 TaxID=171389 RepID=UPI0029372D8A|nr:CHASE2 domain-containing protein [Chroococcidiopsis sp. SAG 2025]